MDTPTPQAMFRYLEWRATEEEHDAEFFEACARRFDALRESLLHNAKVFRERAENIRDNLAFLRGDALA